MIEIQENFKTIFKLKPKIIFTNYSFKKKKQKQPKQNSRKKAVLKFKNNKLLIPPWFRGSRICCSWSQKSSVILSGPRLNTSLNTRMKKVQQAEECAAAGSLWTNQNPRCSSAPSCKLGVGFSQCDVTGLQLQLRLSWNNSDNNTVFTAAVDTVSDCDRDVVLTPGQKRWRGEEEEEETQTERNEEDDRKTSLYLSQQ